jgi:hypothetical protein
MDQNWLKKLQKLGLFGSVLMALINVLTINWIALVAVIVSIYVATEGWTSQFVQKTSTRVFAEVFLAVLWSWIGLLYLRDRKRPRVITVAQDYRYGLTIEGVAINHNPLIEDAALSFPLMLRNYSPGPIRYEITQFDVRIGTRSLPKLKKGELAGYMARGGGKTTWPDPFKKPDIQEFYEKRATGTIEALIIYGHPEQKPVRQLRLVANLILELRESAPTGFNANVVEETDLPIEK